MRQALDALDLPELTESGQTFAALRMLADLIADAVASLLTGDAADERSEAAARASAMRATGDYRHVDSVNGLLRVPADAPQVI